MAHLAIVLLDSHKKEHLQVEILTPHGTMKKSDLKVGEDIASSCLSVQYIFHYTISSVARSKHY